MEYKKGSFGDELAILQAIDGIEVLQDGDSMIAVSGEYQGRIFTSTATGMYGSAYGWFNKSDVSNGLQDELIANLGGESRLWFGPEYGKFALFFEKGAQQVDENRFMPEALNKQKFTELSRSTHAITYEGRMELKNATDYVFDLHIERTISLLTKDQIESELGIKLSKETAFVGFSAKNKVSNVGMEQHKKVTGLIAIWELGCMLTSPNNCVILPLTQETDQITEYFTPIGNRIHIEGSVVFYKADADGINKIGISPAYCKNIMGSYDPSKNQLNIVTFSFSDDDMYVNSIPKNMSPYGGDVINIFNGAVLPAEDLDLPFYEFESSSSAKELRPQEHIIHRHTTYHFEGSFEELNAIAKQTLGVGLSDIPKF